MCGTKVAVLPANKNSHAILKIAWLFAYRLFLCGILLRTICGCLLLFAFLQLFFKQNAYVYVELNQKNNDKDEESNVHKLDYCHYIEHVCFHDAITMALA